MCVTMTHFGYIKRIASDTYRAQNRGGRGVKGQGTREEDFVENLFVTSTHNYIMFFTNYGRAFKIKCYVIPEAGRAAKGTAIVNLLQLQGGERITAAFPVSKEEQGEYLVMATKQGVIKKTALREFDNIRKGGIIALGLREGDELMGVCPSGGDDEFMIATRSGKSIRFSEQDVRAMGRAATGVKSISLHAEDAVVGIVKVTPGFDVLTVTENGMGKRTPEEQYRGQKRGGKGVIAMQVTEKSGALCGLSMVDGTEDLLLIRDDGMVIRMPVSQISVTQNRGTQGVRLMRTAEDTRVVSIAIAPPVEETPEEEKDGAEVDLFKDLT
jgi:DNA gyrase subunit A